MVCGGLYKLSYVISWFVCDDYFVYKIINLVIVF